MYYLSKESKVSLKTQGNVKGFVQAISTHITTRMLQRKFTKTQGTPMDWDSKEEILSEVAKIKATIANIELVLSLDTGD